MIDSELNQLHMNDEDEVAKNRARNKAMMERLKAQMTGDKIDKNVRLGQDDDANKNIKNVDQSTKRGTKRNRDTSTTADGSPIATSLHTSPQPPSTGKSLGRISVTPDLKIGKTYLQMYLDAKNDEEIDGITEEGWNYKPFFKMMDAYCRRLGRTEKILSNKTP